MDGTNDAALDGDMFLFAHTNAPLLLMLMPILSFAVCAQYGRTPLHFASEYWGPKDVAALLLERGAKVDAVSDFVGGVRRGGACAPICMKVMFAGGQSTPHASDAH